MSAGQFVKAEKEFGVLRDEEHDKPGALMAVRCRELISDPPKDWNGIYELKTK